jgi:hypothetical protein
MQPWKSPPSAVSQASVNLSRYSRNRSRSRLSCREQPGRGQPHHRRGGRVDPVSQSIKVIGEITGDAPELMAGMSGRATITPCRSTAFSASSRLFDLNGEAKLPRTKLSSLIIPSA